jgi:hypothetical protein
MGTSGAVPWLGYMAHDGVVHFVVYTIIYFVLFFRLELFHSYADQVSGQGVDGGESKYSVGELSVFALTPKRAAHCDLTDGHIGHG